MSNTPKIPQVKIADAHGDTLTPAVRQQVQDLIAIANGERPRTARNLIEHPEIEQTTDHTRISFLQGRANVVNVASQNLSGVAQDIPLNSDGGLIVVANDGQFRLDHANSTSPSVYFGGPSYNGKGNFYSLGENNSTVYEGYFPTTVGDEHRPVKVLAQDNVTNEFVTSVGQAEVNAGGGGAHIYLTAGGGKVFTGHESDKNSQNLNGQKQEVVFIPKEDQPLNPNLPATEINFDGSEEPGFPDIAVNASSNNAVYNANQIAASNGGRVHIQHTGTGNAHINPGSAYVTAIVQNSAEAGVEIPRRNAENGHYTLDPSKTGYASFRNLGANETVKIQLIQDLGNNDDGQKSAFVQVTREGSDGKSVQQISGLSEIRIYNVGQNDPVTHQVGNYLTGNNNTITINNGNVSGGRE